MKKIFRCKRILAISIIIALILSMFTGCSFGSKEKEIQILGTSDVHGRFDAFDYALNTANTNGSLTQISTKVKELRKQNPNTLLVDAGDSLQDNMANLFIDDDKHAMIKAMEEMKYDCWTLGNHEFNYGSTHVENFVKMPSFDVLSGNIYKEDGSRLAKPYTIKEVDGVKIAIIGMTTPNITMWDGAKLPGYTSTNPIEETKNAIKEIKDNNAADIMIGVMHMGLKNEYRDNDGVAVIAEACPELSAIVAGHHHETIEGETINKTLVVEPGKFGEYLSQINIKVKKSGNTYEVKEISSNAISMKDTAEDQELVSVLKPYHDKAIEVGEVVIGELTGGDLAPKNDIKDIPQAQLQDTALLDLILSTEEYYSKSFVPKNSRLICSAALLSAGANLKEGNIRNCDVSNIYKFDNTLNIVKMTGAQLKEYMEKSARYYNQYKEGDLTVSFNPNKSLYMYDMFSGISYEVNISKEAGSRIENLKYSDGSIVSDSDVIYLSTSDYRVSATLQKDLSGDKIEVIHSTTNDDISTIRDLIKLYITEVKSGKITNECTPNWKLTGYNFDPKYRQLAEKLVADGIISVPVSEDGKHINAKSITIDDVKPYES